MGKTRKTIQIDPVIIGILAGALVVLGILGLVIYGLWTLASRMEHAHLAMWAIGATFIIPLAFFTGFWFGKTEVRGFLAGVDTGLDRLAQAVNMRDTSRISIHTAVRAPRQQPANYPQDGWSRNVILPGGLPQGHVPQITHRQLTDDDVLDL